MPSVIAGHDHVRTAVYRGLKGLVALRVTWRANRLHDGNDFDEGCNAFEQDLAPFTTNVASNFGCKSFSINSRKVFGGRYELRVRDGFLDRQGWR